MKFKSQVCTTREQSERLLALGLKKETADMSWFRRSTNTDFECCTSSYTEWVEEILPIVDDYTLEDIIPAWSLHRLLEMLYADIGECMIFFPNTYDEIIADIENCIRRGIFNKDYLKEKQ